MPRIHIVCLQVPDWCELYGSVRITKGVFQGYLGTVMSIAKTPLTGYVSVLCAALQSLFISFFPLDPQVSVLVSGEPKKQQIKLKHLGQASLHSRCRPVLWAVTPPPLSPCCVPDFPIQEQS